jgi:hypothetical protein
MYLLLDIFSSLIPIVSPKKIAPFPVAMKLEDSILVPPVNEQVTSLFSKIENKVSEEPNNLIRQAIPLDSTVKLDTKSPRLSLVPAISFNASHEDIIREEIRMKKAEEEENRKKQEIREMKLEEITQKLKNKYESKLTIKCLNRLYLASRISRYYNVILRKLTHLKKVKIFKALKKGVFYQKLNREYIEQILSIQYNELTTYQNFMSDLDYYRVTFSKDDFFTYQDIRNTLIRKPIGDGLNHVKIVFYTQRMEFYSTSIFQDLFRNGCTQGLEINESHEGLDIIDRGYAFKLDNDEIKSVTIVLKFIFIDKIENIAQYIHDNQGGLDKYTYGLVYIDFSRFAEIHLNNLFILLDYSCAYKKLMFIESISYRRYDNIKEESIKLLMTRGYKIIKSSYQFCSKRNFSDYFSNIIEYYNNKTIFELFENEIEVQSYEVFGNMRIMQYYRELGLQLDQFLFNKELYVNIGTVTHYQWVKWFTNVSASDLTI